MLLISNGGELKINTVADLDGYGMVWFDSRAITNILLLTRVCQTCKVYYDCEQGVFWSPSQMELA